ncbi:MAG TPA: glucose-1-phosphate cytidylyltransferase [Bacteroidales bacterium]|nr:glucose-1-phosphate cytidylyltransferase [Bacteroidales bacterium]
MKILILAGGFGTRMSEETDLKPKPMIPIGSKPIIWHIMKIYSHFGFNDFVILLGYKGYIIKEYFANYFLHRSDVTIDIAKNEVRILNNHAEPWKVTLIDTGFNTMTGGRILRVRDIVGNNSFGLTYGDGVGNIDINHLVNFHRLHGKSVTMTTVQPEGRFGGVELEGISGRVNSFIEKPPGDGGWINAGFFVCEPKVFDYITEGDKTIWERAPLENLARDGELYAFRHTGFWKPMDTLRDNKQLNEMWESNTALWKLW